MFVAGFAGQTRSFFEVFLHFEEMIEEAVTQHQERNHEEREVHFEQNVEESMQTNGDAQSLTDFFSGKNTVAFEMEDRVKKIHEWMAIFTNFFGPQRIGEVSHSIVVTVNPREKNVREGGEQGSEHEGNEQNVHALIFPDVIEIKDVFDEGETERRHDGKLNSVVDVSKKAFVGFAHDQILHVFLDHSHKHVGKKTSNGKIEMIGEGEQIGLKIVGVIEDVRLRQIFPTPLINEDGNDRTDPQ